MTVLKYICTHNLFDCGLFAVTDAGVETQEINEMENEDVTYHQPSNEMLDEPQSGLSSPLTEDLETEETTVDSAHEKMLTSDDDETLQCGRNRREQFNEAIYSHFVDY